jgi:hypothetical protein
VSRLIAYGCWILAATVGAGAQKEDAQTEVVIRVSAPGNISIMVLAPAKAEAATVLRAAGIQVRWGTVGAGKHEVRECSGNVVEVIDLVVVERSDHQDHPGALGYSLPFAASGTRVVIFYDRVAAQQTKPSATILGFAMAHEVGHVLRGTDGHTPYGVMRAHWNELDYSRMDAHVLKFAAGDADSMRQRLAKKARFCAATASTGPVTKEHSAE